MAKEITAFIARSFAKDDEQRLGPLLDFLKAFEPLGFKCQSAQPAEAEQVSQKIQKLIRESDVFIGMFTRKYPVYASSGIAGEPTKWTAPSWVLQESGYALGHSKKMIFFVEPDVELPELQGDFEYIVYDVAAKEKTFQRASEMITKIIAGALAIRVETVVRREEQAPPPELPLAKPEESQKPEKGIGFFFGAVNEALRGHDDAGAEEAYEKLLDSLKPSKMEDEVFWKSWYQAERALAGYSDALSKLKWLEKENPASHEPTLFYAECQESFGDPRAASEGYMRAAQKTEGSSRTTIILRAAEALRKCEDYEEANRLLLQTLPEANDTQRLSVFSKLYENFKALNQPYKAFAVGEYALFENGAQTDLHFNLGFDFSEAEFNELSIFHYKAVLDQRFQDPAALNNLGVAYTAVNLPILAVQNHKLAAVHGNTLSAGNLAYKYVDAGMVEEATKIIQPALIQTDHDIKVDEAVAEIRKRTEAEREKEKNTYSISTEQRAFFREFGSAILYPETGDIAGLWTFPFGDIPIKVEDGGIEGDLQKPPHTSTFALLAGAKPDKKTKSYMLRGDLTGRICDYYLMIDPDVSNPKSVPSNEHGYLIFDKDGKRASGLILSPNVSVFAATRKGPLKIGATTTPDER